MPSRIIRALWARRRQFFRLLLGVALLCLLAWGGKLLYDHFTASPAKWQAEMTAGKAAEAQRNLRLALSHYQAAVREAEKFGADDLRLADSLTMSGRMNYRTAVDATHLPPVQLIRDSAGSLLDTEDKRNLAIKGAEFYRAISSQKQYHLARRELQQALAIRERVQGKNAPTLLMILEYQVELYEWTQEEKILEPLLLRIIAIKEQAYGAHDPRVADTLHWLIRYLANADGGVGFNTYAQKILRYAQRVYAIRELHPGKRGSDLLSAARELADSYTNAGETASPIPLWQRTIATLEKRFGANNLLLPEAYICLANACQSRHDIAAATAALHEGALIHEHILTSGSWNEALDELAKLYESQHTPAKEEQLRHEFLALRTRLYGATSRRVMLSYTDLGTFYEKHGNLTSACENFQQALHLKEQVYGVNWGSIRYSRIQLSALYRKCGNKAAADSLDARNKALEGRWEYRTPKPQQTGAEHPPSPPR